MAAKNPSGTLPPSPVQTALKAGTVARLSLAQRGQPLGGSKHRVD